jgi:hypothetical protein
MTSYTYECSTNVNLESFESLILKSVFKSKYNGLTFTSETLILTCDFISDLTSEEKTILDGFISSWETEFYNLKKSENVGRIWEAAHEYEYNQISGSAVGLVTMGIIMSKPKCYAVQLWIKTIWDLYYTRKPQVTDVLDPTFLDYTSCGSMPYSVPELMQEVLG